MLALAVSGRHGIACQELVRLARANVATDWRFPEWFKDERGTPKGMGGRNENVDSGARRNDENSWKTQTPFRRIDRHG
ncbi:MAG: hypothetical protein ABI478_00585 [Propionivibrio sp.]